MLQTLQASRGIAAISVAAFHLSLGLGEPRYLGYTVLTSLTWRLDLGVDFFFVLSGFIIAFAHRNDIGRPERLRSYAARRFTRVYPIYWVYTGVLCAMVSIFPTTVVLPADSISWISVITLVRGDEVTPPLPPAWSLFHEVAFYCIFSISIINRAFGAAVLALWCVVILTLFSYAGKTPLLVWTSAYNLDFLIGIGAFHVWNRGSQRVCALALLAGVGLIAASFMAELKGVGLTVFPLVYALGFGGIIAGLVSIEATTSLDLPVLRTLGDASYSIYLLHMPLEGFFIKVFIWFDRQIAIGPYAIYVAVLSCVVAASVAAHFSIEAPLLRWIRSRERLSPSSRRLEGDQAFQEVESCSAADQAGRSTSRR